MRFEVNLGAQICHRARPAAIRFSSKPLSIPFVHTLSQCIIIAFRNVDILPLNSYLQQDNHTPSWQTYTATGFSSQEYESHDSADLTYLDLLTA